MKTFELKDVIVCDCGEPMLPNLSTEDSEGMAWNCTNSSCRDFTGGEIEAEDLIACGVPEWVAHRIEALSDALLEIGMTR